MGVGCKFTLVLDIMFIWVLAISLDGCWGVGHKFIWRLAINSDESESEIFIRSYFRPRRPLLRPYLVAVAEASWKNKN